MKLIPVNDPRPGQTIQCSRCFRMMPADQMQADLEGPAFEAYYCRSCVWLPSASAWRTHEASWWLGRGGM